MLTDRLKHSDVGTDKELVGAPTQHFDEGWKRITLAAPDKNTAADTRAELLEIRRLHKNATPGQLATAKRQDRVDLEDEFFGLLERMGVAVPKKVKEELRTLSEELATVGLFFKDRFQRPRPNQLFKAMGLKELPEQETAKSPSYPSNHALIGSFLADWLAERFPEQSVALKALGRQLGDLRVVAGSHFPSDIEAGRRLATKLKSFYRG